MKVIPLLFVAFLLFPQMASAAPVATGQITEFDLPTANSGPFAITVGPDGNVWFSEAFGDRIGRITPTGVITEFDLPTADAGAVAITTGPDGNLWFTEQYGNKIGRITPTGVITEFDLPTADAGPNSITTGPDDSLWFSQVDSNKIGRITPTGVITEFDLPTSNSGANSITTGPDGNLWFTEVNGNRIGRITPTGVITEFDLPTAGLYSSGPTGITTGFDGNLWFTELYGNRIGRITPTGVITEFDLPTGVVDIGDGRMTSAPVAITTGPDGNLWFTEQYGNKIGRITPTGVITEFDLPTAVDLGGGIMSSVPTGITTGPDGNLWFTEVYGNKIGVLRFGGGQTPPLAIAPSVTTNGNKAITDNPVIPARPIFTGRAIPGAQIVVTVRSDPITCGATADNNGNWSCQLPRSLLAGRHTVYVQVTNPDDSIVNLGPYTVTVAADGASASLTPNTPLAPRTGFARVSGTSQIVIASYVLAFLSFFILACYILVQTSRISRNKYSR